MFPPKLSSDEREILRGRFGGVAWIYTFMVAVGLAATVVLMPLALFFWLRSSRFVLTDRRLVVKPCIGKPQEVMIEQLKGVKITIGTATDSVFVDGPVTLRIRYQREYEKVWGALLVMCHWPMPQSSPLRGPGCDLSAHTLRRSSEISQAGMSVISGGQLAFIPLNSGLRKGGIAKRAVLASVGMRETSVRAEFPVSALVNALLARGGDFAGNVAALAESLGGLVWSLPQTQRQPSRHGLMVTVGAERLELHTDEKSALIIAGGLAVIPSPL
jgi:hypothetical protein